MVVRIFFAFIAGIIIGFEREQNGKPAGIRTQMLICAGSALLTLISINLRLLYNSPNADPARLMAQIVTGIGFVGGGVILKSSERVFGVTTAATIWVAAAVGIAIGSGFYLPAAFIVLLVLLLQPIADFQFKYGLKKNTYSLAIQDNKAHEVQDILHQLGITYTIEKDIDDEVFFTISSYKQKNRQLIESLSSKEILFDLHEIEE